jgi:biopolymer transport protein ExbD
VKLRRNQHPVQLDMTPLIDVVFLLLTFFIFALVLMVRADVLDIRLPEIGQGESAAGVEAVVLTLDRDGVVFIDGDPVQEGDLGALIGAARESRPGASVIISADERAPAGALIALADTLIGAGITEFSVAGTPKTGPPDGPSNRGSSNPAAPGVEE